jgi:hypothetical protein
MQSQQADACAGIEDDYILVWRFDLNTGGIAPGPDRAGPRNRNRTSHSPESDSHGESNLAVPDGKIILQQCAERKKVENEHLQRWEPGQGLEMLKRSY